MQVSESLAADVPSSSRPTHWRWTRWLASFDAIHASPPRLIVPVRRMLRTLGLPYLIENVEGAPLEDPVALRGTMFPGLRFRTG